MNENRRKQGQRVRGVKPKKNMGEKKRRLSKDIVDERKTFFEVKIWRGKGEVHFLRQKENLRKIKCVAVRRFPNGGM